MPDFDFWNQRWLNHQIGFHLPKPHPSLVKHVDLFQGHQKILVPLCGKSLDMMFLREKGFEVVGVEFSELALKDFIAENKLTMTRFEEDSFVIYRGEGFTLYCGDFFHLTSKELQGVSAFYDRASMVAFDPQERLRYASHLISVGRQLKLGLVVVFNYGDIPGGPPYSVVDQEIKELYSPAFLIKQLSVEEFPLREALRERGAQTETEVTWMFNRAVEY